MGAAQGTPRWQDLLLEHVLTAQSGRLQLVSRSCGTAKRGEEGGIWYGHRDTRVSTFVLPLFLLGEELYRQPRAVYKCWAVGLRSCDHAVTSSSSSSSSTSVFRSSTKCWTFLLCFRDRYPQSICAGTRCASCSGYGRPCDHTAYVAAVL